MSATEEVVRATLRRCERVSAGVAELMPRLGPILADPPDDLSALAVDDRTAAVAYLKRFEQLQDLAARLARSVLSWEGLDARAMSVRDLGDWLEKLGILPDADDWMRVARLRNRLVHEYPVEDEEQVARLRETGDDMPALRDWVRAFPAFLRGRGVPL